MKRALVALVAITTIGLGACGDSGSSANRRPRLAPDNAHPVETEVGTVWMDDAYIYVDKCDTIRRWIDGHNLYDLVGVKPVGFSDWGTICG